MAASEPQSRSRIAFDYTTWDQYLGGSDSSQYSSLDQINRGNVTELELAWSFPTGQANPTFNPIVVDGIMYVLAGRTYVALDAATGEEIWRHENEGPVGTRGVNYWESEDRSDRRLVFLNSGMLSAIDAQTGEAITSFGDNGKVDLRIGLAGTTEGIRALQTSNPGRIFEDLIIISLPASGASYTSLPADIHAYNILTGELEWVFHTVPRPGEFGADTWPEEGLGRYGGVHNWSESTVDTELGIVYIPTGTARFDFYGGNRHGQNLFGNSIVALDARTGERLWHFQTIHHDLWDLDIPQAPKLLTVTHDGEEIQAVAQATKQGLLFVFDRVTGEPLWEIEERPVPESDVPGEEAWPTQPFPTRPPPFARQSFTVDDINPYIPEADQQALRENLTNVWRNEGSYTPPSLEGTVMMPGHNGGTNWGGSAVDPVNGRFFVVSKELPTLVTLSVPGEGGRRGGGGVTVDQIPGAGEDFVPYVSPVNFMIQSEGLSAIGPPWSQLTAYDLNTGEIIWQVPNGGVYELMQQGIEDTGAHAPRGGPVVTAGGLIFVATASDRKFRARDVDSGAVLWEYDLPAGSDGVPAVYAVDGRQYIAVPVGGNGLFSQGLEIPEPGPGQYMVFALPAP
ncbi:MAG: pyrroloquinoline quinone-dependent dehydrogenase [Gammaproteobacteria bacterium]|nr:pyrroloquinoline quinone-dependent dehydrogenase [Gammaproteobacteria bacterium]